MIRLLGCTLVAGAAAFMGFRTAAGLRGEIRMLDELAAGLELLEQELELYAPELEVLMRNVGRRARGGAKALFSGFADGLSERSAEVSAQWEDCVSRMDGLIPEGKSCLYGLGAVLGRYESREQRNCVAAVRRRLEHLREREEARCVTRCRTCQTIGLSGGAFLMILLL